MVKGRRISSHNAIHKDKGRIEVWRTDGCPLLITSRCVYLILSHFYQVSHDLFMDQMVKRYHVYSQCIAVTAKKMAIRTCIRGMPL